MWFALEQIARAHDGVGTSDPGKVPSWSAMVFISELRAYLSTYATAKNALVHSAEASAFRIGVSCWETHCASVDVMTKWLYITVEISSAVKFKGKCYPRAKQPM